MSERLILITREQDRRFNTQIGVSVIKNSVVVGLQSVGEKPQLSPYLQKWQKGKTSEQQLHLPDLVADRLRELWDLRFMKGHKEPVPDCGSVQAYLMGWQHHYDSAHPTRGRISGEPVEPDQLTEGHPYVMVWRTEGRTERRHFIMGTSQRTCSLSMTGKGVQPLVIANNDDLMRTYGCNLLFAAARP